MQLVHCSRHGLHSLRCPTHSTVDSLQHPVRVRARQDQSLVSKSHFCPHSEAHVVKGLDIIKVLHGLTERLITLLHFLDHLRPYSPLLVVFKILDPNHPYRGSRGVDRTGGRHLRGGDDIRIQSQSEHSPHPLHTCPTHTTLLRALFLLFFSCMQVCT